MSISLKEGARVQGLAPETVLAITVAGDIFNRFKKEMVITSGTDGQHSHRSLHYTGHAVDIRSRHLTQDQKSAIARLLKDALGDEYDVVVEPDHFHVEFDPRK
jgi:hypothetical protein